MKKVVALALVLVLALCLFCGCAALSGSYESGSLLGSKVTYKFNGNKVSIVVTAFGTDLAPIEGTYQVTKNDDGSQKLVITVPSESEDAKDYSGSHAFEKGSDYIKIDGTLFSKVK